MIQLESGLEKLQQRQHIWRYELKYFMRARLLTDVSSFFHGHLDLDNHSRNGRYNVHSLYFDSHGLNTYWAKKAGDLVRHKFRLRRYDGAANTGVLEIKKRRGQKLAKERFQGALDHLFDVAVGKTQATDDAAQSLPSLKIIQARHTYEPMAYINYERRPFVDGFNQRTRVTIDGPIFSSPCHTLSEFEASSSGDYDLLKGNYLVEIKFDEREPYWLRTFVQSFSLPIVSYSKYIEGIQHLVSTNSLAMGFHGPSANTDTALIGYL